MTVPALATSNDRSSGRINVHFIGAGWRNLESQDDAAGAGDQGDAVSCVREESVGCEKKCIVCGCDGTLTE